MPNSLAKNLTRVLQESGFLVPNSFINNSDQDIGQLVAIAQGCCAEIIKEPWQRLRKFYTFTLTSLTTYSLPSDFGSYLPSTMYQEGRWDRADMPTTEDCWAFLSSTTGISNLPIRVRIIRGVLNIMQPQVGATISMEYMQNTPVENATTGAFQQEFLLDTDLWMLDDRLFQLEVKWKFKKEKGIQDWNADLQAASVYRSQLLAVDQGNSTILPNTATTTMGQPYTQLWVS